MSQRSKPPQSGAQRTGQAENWGRPSGGTDFLLARPGGGFSVTSRRPCVVAVTGGWRRLRKQQAKLKYPSYEGENLGKQTIVNLTCPAAASQVFTSAEGKAECGPAQQKGSD